MKRSIILLLGVAIATAAVPLYSALRTDDNSARPTNVKTDQVTDRMGGAPKTEGHETIVDGNSLSIVSYAFVPQTLTIKKGTTVSWTNDDSVLHGVISSSGGELNIPLIGKNESSIHTFSKQGTFDYYCQSHPYMKGTVIVMD